MTSTISQTPNFALNPSDIPRVETGDIPPTRMTLQTLILPSRRSGVQCYDALVNAENSSPSILLDFVYGASAYRCWDHAGEVRELLEARFRNENQENPSPVPPPIHDSCANFVLDRYKRRNYS
jgi:hypothetical protein